MTSTGGIPLGTRPEIVAVVDARQHVNLATGHHRLRMGCQWDTVQVEGNVSIDRIVRMTGGCNNEDAERFAFAGSNAGGP